VAADPREALAASLAETRRAIARIAEDRQATERDFGAVVLNAAELGRVLQEQRVRLDRTLAEIDRARDLAGRAARRAGTDGAEVAAYEETVAGLQRQAEVVGSARAQLAEADGMSRQNVVRAHALLRANRARLDASLREQLDLLARLERLDRDSSIARRLE
jgi:hypothetical protein